MSEKTDSLFVQNLVTIIKAGMSRLDDGPPLVQAALTPDGAKIPLVSYTYSATKNISLALLDWLEKNPTRENAMQVTAFLSMTSHAFMQMSDEIELAYSRTRRQNAALIMANFERPE